MSGAVDRAGAVDVLGQAPGQVQALEGELDGGGCLLANLAHRFGTTRFVNILERYAADHWLGVTRTTDFQARIEAAAAKHLPGLDMDAYWATWRVN